MLLQQRTVRGVCVRMEEGAAFSVLTKPLSRHSNSASTFNNTHTTTVLWPHHDSHRDLYISVRLLLPLRPAPGVDAYGCDGRRAYGGRRGSYDGGSYDGGSCDGGSCDGSSCDGSSCDGGSYGAGGSHGRGAAAARPHRQELNFMEEVSSYNNNARLTHIRS